MTSSSSDSKEYFVDESVEKIGCTISSTGFRIKKFAAGGWAEQQGLQVGDVVTEINGKSVDGLNQDDLKLAMQNRPFSFRVTKPKQGEASADPDAPEKVGAPEETEKVMTKSEYIAEIFKLVDTNGDTYLDAKELFPLAKLLDDGMTEADLEQQFQDICDGVLCDASQGIPLNSFEEMASDELGKFYLEEENLPSHLKSLKMMLQKPKAEPQAQDTKRDSKLDKRQENLKELFSRLDYDQDGALDSKELFQYAKAMGYPSDSAKWEDYLEEVRRDKILSGSLVKEAEFMTITSSEDSDFYCNDLQLEKILTVVVKYQKKPMKAAVESKVRTNRLSFEGAQGEFTRGPRDQPASAPSEELIKAVFALLDTDKDDKLSEQEMLRFIRCLSYPGSDEEWTKEFSALCEFHKWDSAAGVDMQGFVTLLDDADDNYFVEAEQLVSVQQDLEMKATVDSLTAKGVIAAGARVPPGCDGVSNADSFEGSVGSPTLGRRDMSPDSGRDGGFPFSPFASDAESPYGSRTASPSRRAFMDRHPPAPDSRLDVRWPHHCRVEFRGNLMDFKSVLLTRQLSLAGAWRMYLDRHWQGRISLYDFTQACKDIGYKRIQQVWKELDVDQAGSITLAELDYEGAEVLGQFYWALNQRYGSVRAAAKKWKLTGPRRARKDEFLGFVAGAVSPDQGNSLFGMLCSCPHGGLHQLERTAPAVTLREMQWLHKMGPGLPRPAFDRVSPGMLGSKFTPSTATPGASPGGMRTGLSSPGFASPGTFGFASFNSDRTIAGMASPRSMPTGTPRTWFGDGNAYYSDDSTRMATGEDDSGSDSNSENNVFTNLYAKALEHQDRRKKLVEEKQYDFARNNPHLIEKRADPELYQRLYDDHKTQQQNRAQKLEEQREKHKRELVGYHDKSEGRVADKDFLLRLHELKKPDFSAPLAIDTTSLRHQHLWSYMNIQELMQAVTQRVEDLNESSSKNISYKAFGKTRQELITFLKQHGVQRPAPSAAPTHIQKLFDEAQEKKTKIQEKVKALEAQRKSIEKNSWVCDMHPVSGPRAQKPNPECHMCKRYLAAQEGKDPLLCGRDDVETGMHDRLYQQGMTRSEQIADLHAQNFKELLLQADARGILHGKSLKLAKHSLKEAFETDVRWKGVQGRQRDILIQEAVEIFSQRRADAAKKGEPYGQKVISNPETYFRLYLDGKAKQNSIDDKLRKKAMEEAEFLKQTSVHKSVDPSTVDEGFFLRLYESEPREDKAQLVKNSRKLRQNASGDSPQSRKSKTMESMQQNMLVFSFPEAKWPASQYFESEFRYKMESLGAPSMHQFNIRLKEVSTAGGVLVELRGKEKSLENFTGLPLGQLVVEGCDVHEVWNQEAPEDPINDFVDWICETFQSLEHAFYEMDVNQGGAISRAAFMQVCTTKGFTGNKVFVWHALDNGMGALDQRDWMSLQPYVSQKASLQARPHSLQAMRIEPDQPKKPIVEFAILLANRYPDIDDAYSNFSKSGYASLGFPEFQAGARAIGWTGECRQIFQELDVQQKRQIGRKEFQQLKQLLEEEQVRFNRQGDIRGDDPRYQDYDWKKSSLHRGKGYEQGKGGKGGERGSKARASPGLLSPNRSDGKTEAGDSDYLGKAAAAKGASGKGSSSTQGKFGKGGQESESSAAPEIPPNQAIKRNSLIGQARSSAEVLLSVQKFQSSYPETQQLGKIQEEDEQSAATGSPGLRGGKGQFSGPEQQRRAR